MVCNRLPVGLYNKTEEEREKDSREENRKGDTGVQLPGEERVDHALDNRVEIESIEEAVL